MYNTAFVHNFLPFHYYSYSVPTRRSPLVGNIAVVNGNIIRKTKGQEKVRKKGRNKKKKAKGGIK